MKPEKCFSFPLVFSLNSFAAESLNLHFYHSKLASFRVFDVTITHRPFHSPYVSGFSHFTPSPPLQCNTSNPPSWQSLFYSQSLSICLPCFSEGFSRMWFLAPKEEEGEKWQATNEEVACATARSHWEWELWKELKQDHHEIDFNILSCIYASGSFNPLPPG